MRGDAKVFIEVRYNLNNTTLRLRIHTMPGSKEFKYEGVGVALYSPGDKRDVRAAEKIALRRALADIKDGLVISNGITWKLLERAAYTAWHATWNDSDRFSRYSLLQDKLAWPVTYRVWL